MHPKPTSGNYLQRTRQTSMVGLFVNVLLALLKIGAGVFGNSQAVLADGIHSFSDSGTDISILLGAGYWSKPPDFSHPHGHQRIETLVTTAIGIILITAGGLIGYRALSTLHTPHDSTPGWVAFGAALVSIISKEGLYRWTARVGRNIKSSAVVANAVHHRSDAFSSIPVACAVLLARVFPAWAFLDLLASLVVSVFILWAGWQVFWPAARELVDVGASKRELERIRNLALETDGVRKVHGIRTRYLGGSLVVDLHVLVDGSLSVSEGHRISESVKDRLLVDGPGVVDAVVHLEPVQSASG